MILACLYGFLPLLNYKWTYKEIRRNTILTHHVWLVFRIDKQLSQLKPQGTVQTSYNLNGTCVRNATKMHVTRVYMQKSNFACACVRYP